MQFNTMIKISSIVSPAILALLLSSCAIYKEPMNQKNTATVSGKSWDDTDGKGWTRVEMIDHTAAGANILSFKQEYLVTPGTHTFAVYSEFRDKSWFMSPWYRGLENVTATISPNQHYYFVGKVHPGNYHPEVTILLKDQSGRTIASSGN